ncbi:putative serine hydrolase (FSH1) [Lyophyllum shimeji]|uniref:Serine hydrolase (FSH1) n=1 Tax=Lyophyllum shimeji TaxID=47721 RepID=A0A9P3PLX1_LYOSH|nr:putative serine hydrolase (FSH1) [Lyophyllum shimeji]
MAAIRTVLVLHGYSQNASIFSKRLGALRRECGNSVDLVFIDGPHILQPADLPGSTTPSPDDNLASLGAAEAANAGADPTLTPRAWWKFNPDKTFAYGLRESIEAIRDVLKSRRFDGVLGFSQGAAFAAMISALLEKPHLYPPFLVEGQPPHPPLKFCIAVSGFRLRDPFCDPLFAGQYSTPTLHVIGKNDIIVVEERSRTLVEASSNKRVEEHQGGHFVPSKRQWLKFLRGYMLDPSAELLSPSTSGSSAPNSGTATPTESRDGAAATLKL